MTVYNEIEPYAVEWLKNLGAADLVPAGEVISESIVDVEPARVSGRAFHAFAGIGVWAYACRAAGIPDGFPVWTGSCPCQPFSAAGKRGGFDDARHLWPEWFRLIRECRPPLVFGEQVASPDGLAWLDAVHTDLESAGYAFAAFDICAAGFGAPHLRQRLYFIAVADDDETGFGVEWRARLRAHRDASQRHDVDGRSAAGGVVDADQVERERGEGVRREARDRSEFGGGDRGLGDADANASGRAAGSVPGTQAEGAGGGLADRRGADGPGDASADGRLVHADGARPQRRGVLAGDERDQRAPRSAGPNEPGPVNGYWRDAEWIPCRDPERGVIYRPVEPGTFPLAHGATGRVGKLRAYGNAIVEAQAEEFIRCALDVILGN